jgi:putative peptidoglycan lipid II flippase
LPPSRNPLARWLSAQHTVFSATLLLTASALLSRIMGLGRDKFIAWLFGAGPQTDAYVAAFQLPEMLNYFLVGGTASITFVTILSRYRERGEASEGQRAMSAILTAMLIVLSVATVAAFFVAPWYVRTFFPGFSYDQIALCVRMTRILLPAQIFFFAGGVFAAVLLVNKQFAYQALTPLVYNLFIILGGALLARSIGISSLAIGAVAGAFTGPLLLNAIGAHRAGMRYRPLLDLRHPGLREWVRLSIPLMLGVSLVTFDTYILAFFASHIQGDITRLTYAKRLFSAPMAIVGQAAGAASLPFFAALFGQQRLQDFARSVNASVTRILAFSFLLSAWMVALAHPATDLIFRGGRFNRADASLTAIFFAIFSISLAFWAAQAIYARAFYAAGNTLTPMLASTIVTVLSLPVYWFLFHLHGAAGLAIASDLGILLQTATLAVLLHRRKMVSLGGLEFSELARSLFAAVVSAGALYGLARFVTSEFFAAHFVSPAGGFHLTANGIAAAFSSSAAPASSVSSGLSIAGTLSTDLISLTIGTILWFFLCYLTLRLTGSQLPAQLSARLRRRPA